MIKRQINPEVENALRNNIPVVALESTIITHGMPYPENLNMVNDVEKIINQKIEPPDQIKNLLDKDKNSFKLNNKFESFKEFLLSI